MKVLWLCNIVLPDFSDEFHIKKNSYGGWITGMLHEVERVRALDIGLLFPIMDLERMRDGIFLNHRYYSFRHERIDQCISSTSRIARFREIINDFQPDVVHIWGTEYAWSLDMILACEIERE